MACVSWSDKGQFVELRLISLRIGNIETILVSL
jgi:hypothetical protein